MYFAAVALLGASVGQPPIPPSSQITPVVQDHRFWKDRQIKLPIKYERARNTIRQVSLWLSRDGGNTWQLEATVTPDRDAFVYTAKEDGVYWFTIVDEDLKGNKSVIDITKTVPELKVIVKTTKPRVQVLDVKRDGERIDIKWLVDDRYPNENETRVLFKKSTPLDTTWRVVTLPPTSKTGVGFNSGTLEPIVVRIQAFDMALNLGEAIQEIDVGHSNQAAAVFPPVAAPPVSPFVPVSPVAPVPPLVPVVTQTGSVITSTASQVMPAASVPPVVAPTLPVSPPVLPAPAFPSPSTHNDFVAPMAPVSPAPGPPAYPSGPGTVLPPAPAAPTAVPPAIPYVPPSPPPIVAPTPATGNLPSQPYASSTPSQPTPIYSTPASFGNPPAPSTPVAPASTPVAPLVSSGISAPNSGNSGASGLTSSFGAASDQCLPIVDPRLGSVEGSALTPVPVWTGPQTAAPAVEPPHVPTINYLAFDLGYEVETRGPSGISRVDLWVTRDDGRTWVKWSEHDGKGASIRVNLNVPANPQPEGAYGFRVVPISGAGLSERRPASGDAPDLRVVVDVTPPQLALFPPVGDPTSPDVLLIQWRATDKNWGDEPITIEWGEKPTGPWQPVAIGGDVVQTVSGSPPILRHLPNSGQYAWRVPTGLPPRVYLKVCASDAAGNVREVITRDPILVDLVKPRAKINGILPSPSPAPARP